MQPGFLLILFGFVAPSPSVFIVSVEISGVANVTFGAGVSRNWTHQGHHCRFRSAQSRAVNLEAS
jgi:hypothetical protein